MVKSILREAHDLTAKLLLDAPKGRREEVLPGITFSLLQGFAMVLVHLLASPFIGGIERQLLGLASNLPQQYRTVFLSFAERGLAFPFLDLARDQGFEAISLRNNHPHCRRAAREVREHLRRVGADILCCSGYKPDMIGWLASRPVKIPVVSISHGWTAAALKVRLYETLDRLILHRMDRVVCVSQRQAERVRKALVPARQIVVIRNAIQPEAFASPDPTYGHKLREFFPEVPRLIVGAAGRFSPEKGFKHLVSAAESVTRADPGVGFILFGDGPLRESLVKQIAARGLKDRFILGGFRTDLQKFLPHFDLLALPSYTEGLPVVVLEAFAAGVPVVATAVGGTPEVVEDGKNGYLVPAGDQIVLARRILDLVQKDAERQAMGLCGRRRVQNHFTIASQSVQYQRLFENLTRNRKPRGATGVSLCSKSLCHGWLHPAVG